MVLQIEIGFILFRLLLYVFICTFFFISFVFHILWIFAGRVLPIYRIAHVDDVLIFIAFFFLCARERV